MRNNKDAHMRIHTLIRTSGLSSHDTNGFYAAYKAAQRSPFPCFAIGCSLVYGNKVVATGYNNVKSDPFQKHYNELYREFAEAPYCNREHSLHAETAAIKAVPYPVALDLPWSRVKAYIYRIAPGLVWEQGLAIPCNACFHALVDRGIRRIFFTTENGFSEGRISKSGLLII